METTAAVGTGVASSADCSFPGLAAVFCWRPSVGGGSEVDVGSRTTGGTTATGTGVTAGGVARVVEVGAIAGLTVGTGAVVETTSTAVASAINFCTASFGESEIVSVGGT